MCLIAYFKKLRQKHDELEFQRAMERLKKSGFHTIRLDEQMNIFSPKFKINIVEGYQLAT